MPSLKTSNLRSPCKTVCFYVARQGNFVFWVSFIFGLRPLLLLGEARRKGYGHQELIGDIEFYLQQRDANPKPYKWKAKGEEILGKIQRLRMKLQGAQ